LAHEERDQKRKLTQRKPGGKNLSPAKPLTPVVPAYYSLLFAERLPHAKNIANPDLCLEIITIHFCMLFVVQNSATAILIRPENMKLYLSFQ
jgi:hypothetical protein